MSYVICVIREVSRKLTDTHENWLLWKKQVQARLVCFRRTNGLKTLKIHLSSRADVSHEPDLERSSSSRSTTSWQTRFENGSSSVVKLTFRLFDVVVLKTSLSDSVVVGNAIKSTYLKFKEKDYFCASRHAYRYYKLMSFPYCLVVLN